MPTTQFINNNSLVSGTSNLTHLLNERDQQVLRMIMPRDVEKVFGKAKRMNDPAKGYTDPEWYFQASDGCVWGIGWRWGSARLRGRGNVGRGKTFFVYPTPDAAAEFIAFLNSEVS